MAIDTQFEIRVLNAGFVRLDDCMADDLSVVNSARVSFHNHHDEMEEGDDKLISFLMRNRHGTPFEHNSFRFHVRAPLFVFREWQRHRISSYNEWSARYSELDGTFYIPDRENVRTQVGRPGHYTFEPVEPSLAEWFCEHLEKESRKAFANYKNAIAQGVAKELARCFLPVNIFSEMYWTVNARSMMNFLSLRNSKDAQLEIRLYALAIERFFQTVMPVTYDAFLNNGRIAP